MSVLTRTLARTTQNRFVQGLLQRNVLLSQYLMGVGSGGGVQSSGEHAIFEYLRRMDELDELKGSAGDGSDAP